MVSLQTEKGVHVRQFGQGSYFGEFELLSNKEYEANNHVLSINYISYVLGISGAYSNCP